ncbi:oligoendopeptidase F [Peptoniphilus sp. oral taxon 386]|uniref:oligoendopeptidase F n=1 Tax=Peptoniphilus sp. oral taxon 386 TaxID=652713 RepID=UPI0001DAA417|nr:oligoendopeptidase F [Peptoniphilus sp. oral taxon 386]EFI41317.1 oligoendopeptidase F [Peptoniphilus sp. oral taxon 386 str. F0131]
MEALKNRSEIDESLKWDLSRIFKSEDEYNTKLNEMIKLSDELVKFKGNIKNSEDLLNSIKIYEKIMEAQNLTSNYASLSYSVDLTDEESRIRIQKFDNIENNLMEKISFYENEILSLDVEIIEETINSSDKYKMYLKTILKNKEHILSEKEEKVIATLAPSIAGPYKTYEDSKASDMTFDDFVVGDKTYANSFVLYENFYCYDTNEEVRRKAYESFSKGLDRYKNTFASVYINHVTNEKQIATLRGFDSVIDYLLFNQGVDRKLYDRQIDLMTEKLAPHMRKYAKLIKKFYNIDKMTFADLKVPIDAEFVPKITIEESKDYVKDALSVMGEEYLDVAMSSYSNRWIDFANNIGKSTGGFCASPYKCDSFILLSFTEQLNEVYTLVHEIGHGVHFHNAQANNSVLEEEPSLYFIESPSTINELLLSNSLLKKATDDRFKRFVYAAQIGNTYYHNCVTHLLEAAYQREVYRLVDAGEPLTEKTLTKITKEVHEKFWADAVEIDDYAALTWMRQPHYYMGLYSYTYSAGLSIATEVAKRIMKDGKVAADAWIDALCKGGSLEIIDLCKVAGVDITKEDFILNTIDYIGDIIDKIEELM